MYIKKSQLNRIEVFLSKFITYYTKLVIKETDKDNFQSIFKHQQFEFH